jgi:NADPH2:quinone reductase
MRAVTFAQFGDSSVLEVSEVAEPKPGVGDLLVRVTAAGINFIDIYRRSGIYPVDLPHTLGDEGVGVVEQVGGDVTGWQVGDRVAFVDGRGTFADFTLVDAEAALRVPDDVDDHTAAALPLQGMTAHYLVRSTFVVNAEHTVLIHAGAGGVGALAIQLAKAQGARVFTTVSNDAKAEIARAAGADEILDYESFDEQARALTGGRGVDAVFDGVGQATFDRSLASLTKRGIMVLFGAASGPVPDFNLQRLNAGGSLFVTRPTLKDYLLTREEREWRWSELMAAVQTGALTVRIGGVYPLEGAAEAFDDLAARKTTGKLLVLPQNPDA